MKNLLLKKLEKSCLILITLLIGSVGYAQIALRGTTTGTSTNTSLTINKPAALVVDDLMIVNIAQGNNNSTAPSLTGWTLIDGRSLGSSRYGAVLFRVATSSDVLASSFTFTMGSGTNSASGAIISFSGVDENNPFDVASNIISVQPLQNTVNANTLTTVSANAAIIMLGQAVGNTASTWSSWTATTPATFTELFDVQNTSGLDTSIGGAWATRATAGPTGTGGAILSSNQRNGGILLALRPCIANTITLSSAIGTDAQTSCVFNSINNITYDTTNATGATFSGLPAGISGSWAGNVITIFGASFVSGTFPYTVTLTGGCGPAVTASGTITVAPLNTATLTSGPGTEDQTICLGNPITNITYNTTGATNALFFGLPAGVTGSLAANVITISGTPIALGTFNYSIFLFGGSSCPILMPSKTIIVNTGNTISLSSAASTTNQTTCINTAITNITYNTTGATGATFSGLPAGVTGTWAANVATISGTPSVAGTFPYIVTLTGGCGTMTASGTITVLTNTITLSSAVGTDNPTVCINTPITTITYNTTGATGATFSGLPTGVAGTWAGNVATISGTPSVAGIFPYTVTLTGGCGTINATGTITSNANNTITLSSGAGTNNQTRCINTAMSSITFNTVTATGATFVGLPAGTVGNWIANVVTISGTPTASGLFPYTVTLTGGCGPVLTASGTITVTPINTVTLTSAIGTDAQTRCITTPITTITYSTAGATGVTFSGFPTGVTGAWVGNVATISGTPSVAGPFIYTVTLTGGCGPVVTATGTITVSANNTITLSSGVGTNNQTRCINTAISSITFNTVTATGATFVGLPAGVTGNWAANVVTVSGTPTASGSFPYTVTLTGGCGISIATGTITVTPNNVVTLTSAVGTNAQTRCISTAIANITYGTNGATGATFSGLPTGVSGTWAGNVATISGTPSVAGTFNYTVALTGGCGTITAAGTIMVDLMPTITGTTPGSRTGVGTVPLGATASFGTVNWYANLTGGTSLGTGTSFTTPIITTTTTYFVEAVNGACTSSPRFAIIATVGYPEIDIQGNATSIVNGDTSPTTVDWTDFSNLTTTRTFTILNTNPFPLNIGAITFTGVNPLDFSITTLPASIIIAGSSSTFTVQFSPLTNGIKTAIINIVNNDANENPYTFTIRAEAIDREINIQGNGVSIIDGDTTPAIADWTDFSMLTTTRTFTIQNTGASPLTIGAITFSGTNAADFSIVTTPPATIAGYSSGTFVVRFTPSATGTRTATMSIVNNDSNEDPYDFALRGDGVAQEINLTGNGNSIATGDLIPATSDWTDFSNVAVTRTFTIQNTGSMNLTIGAITIGGANPSDFSITTAPSTIVAGITSSTFVISFNPTVVGIRTATISIPNNDTTGGENPYTFGISATSASEIAISGLFVNIVDNDITPSQDDWTDYGTVSIENGNVLANYVIRNSGTGPLVIGAITIAGLNASDFTVTGLPSASLAAGGSTILQISFNPTVLGVKNATISIANNDIDENPYNFSIRGTGVRTYIDTDGDGITDNFDLDDDNDGIVDTLEQASCITSPFATSITQTFLNETFGSGKTRGLININIPGASTTSCYEDGITTNANNCPTNGSGRLDDGEYCVNYFISHASNASDPESVHLSLAWTDQLDRTPADVNGRMAIYNADNTAGTYFYQVIINGVIPNAPVNFDFWLLNIMRQGNVGGSILPNITVEFRDITDTILYTSYNTGNVGRCSATNPLDNSCGPSLSNWLNYTTTVNLGNVTNFLVKIRNNAAGGGGNDFAMDDILISQTYCDWDADGVPNLYDLDSDNDGIADIEEGGFRQYSSGLSRMNLSSAATWSDANGNGMNDAIDPAYTGASNFIPDTDGDGARDAIDLDSDNDSQFDVDEAIANMGDGDINGDGRGDGIDTDRDGILDIYDTFNGFGTATRPFAQNSDSVGNPDFLQVDANNDGITDIAASLYASLDGNANGIIDGNTDVDRDGITDIFDTNTTVIGSPRDLNRKLFLDFDGRNDYAEDVPLLGGLPNASLMAWIDLNNAFSTTGVVVGQDRFQIRVSSARTLQASVNGTTVTFATPLNRAQWYHVAATYGGGNLNLYLNGSLVATQAITGAIAADATRLTLGKNPSTLTNYFRGKIDEVRVFNVTLTPLQVQRMVHQEIQDDEGQVRGAIIPRNIGSLPYVNILRYYRMDIIQDDIVDNFTTSPIDVVTGMRLYNHKVIAVQQAPMPFVTVRTGTFAAAVHDATNNIRGLDVLDFDASIIQVRHNITETGNNTDIGMLVEPNVTITMTNNTRLQNNWYLQLHGTIDLVGRSQLIQTADSDLEPTSTGFIEKDQQGQSNMFNYNYWSSPVSSINNTTINHGFTVAGVLRDGTTASNPQPLQWTTGINGSATAPITLSSYWIFKFQNSSNAYANWSSVGQNGTLLAGQGYTMKGAGAAAANQNYTFVGKPNNGPITSPVGPNNLNLCGNPYPSAIDANQFIDDNAASLVGTLYLWEHYNTNTSHNTVLYQGGYATYTKTGGTAPVAPAGVSGLGSSSKTPNRFIPVGQGFFVTGSVAGGTINFNNGQRLFVKEDDAASYTMFRQNNNFVNVSNPAFDNFPDSFIEEEFMKIRLGYNSTDNYHRQTLLGFMNQNATAGYDNGYDAISIEALSNDMYFINGTNKLNISGEGFFNANNIYPLGVKNAVTGNVSFVIDGLENFPNNQEIYIYDNVTATYNSIKDQNFQINLPAGTYETRFSLRFANGATLGTDDNQTNQAISVIHSQANNTINIKNEMQEAIVKSVALYNLLGQEVQVWNVYKQNQADIKLRITDMPTGTYIVKVTTDGGEITKKIVVK